MRIISGQYKGKRLTAPKNLPVRPTTDMAKEALFNILANRYQFEDLTIIDLFSGTGNISYEFASRGTKNITAVDAHAKCLQFIQKTNNLLDFQITTVKSDASKFLKRLTHKVDIIFADPPYDMAKEELKKIIEVVFNIGLLNNNGLLVFEHAVQTDLSDIVNYSGSRKYGSSVFSFFENNAGHKPDSVIRQ